MVEVFLHPESVPLGSQPATASRLGPIFDGYASMVDHGVPVLARADGPLPRRQVLHTKGPDKWFDSPRPRSSLHRRACRPRRPMKTFFDAVLAATARPARPGAYDRFLRAARPRLGTVPKDGCWCSTSPRAVAVFLGVPVRHALSAGEHHRAVPGPQRCAPWRRRPAAVARRGGRGKRAGAQRATLARARWRLARGRGAGSPSVAFTAASSAVFSVLPLRASVSFAPLVSTT